MWVRVVLLGRGGQGELMFDFTNKQEATKILVDFTQAYDTIDIDAPGLPSDFFTDEVTVESLENFVTDEGPPMYVQSITYGRRVLFAVASSYTESDVRFAFEAGFDAFLVGGGVEIETQHLDILSQSKITASVLGGDAEGAAATVLGLDQLLTFITEGGNYAPDSPGVPIAFKLAYLDNAPARLALTSEFPETICQ